MEYLINIVSRVDLPVIELEDMKRDLDVTYEDDDATITQHIAGAVGYVEQYTNLLLSPTTIDMVTGQLPAQLRLPRGPVQSVTSISVDGVAIAGFRTLLGGSYTVLPPAGQFWPSTATVGGSTIRFVAGYPEGQVPAGILGSIKQIVSIYYDKPTGNELTAQWDAVHRILSPFKWRRT